MLASCQYNSPNYFKKFDGTFIGAHHPGSKDAPSTYVNRAKFHGILEEYARQQCIDIEYSDNVVEYFKTFDDGHSRIADVIVAADGVGTKSWGLLHGSKAEPINSGFAVTRVTFPAGPALENLVIVKEFEGFSHRVSLHVGPDSHMVVGKTDTEICWLLNHPVSTRVFDVLRSVSNGFNRTQTGLSRTGHTRHPVTLLCSMLKGGIRSSRNL
jgi:hypothetical protein